MFSFSSTEQGFRLMLTSFINYPFFCMIRIIIYSFYPFSTYVSNAFRRSLNGVVPSRVRGERNSYLSLFILDQILAFDRSAKVPAHYRIYNLS